MGISISIIEQDEKFTKMLLNYLDVEPSFTINKIIRVYEDALEILPLGSPSDVVLISLDSIRQLQKITYLSSEILSLTKSKIIILSSLEDEEAVLQTFSAGAVNYISKKKICQIPNAIHTACNSFNPLEVLIYQYYKLKQEQILLCLSKSEREIFELLMQGYTQVQIQEKLVKSIYTVKNQVGQILKKMNVNSTKEMKKKPEFRKL